MSGVKGIQPDHKVHITCQMTFNDPQQPTFLASPTKRLRLLDLLASVHTREATASLYLTPRHEKAKRR